ncbi:glycosyltransferase family 2 protein [Pedobacter fastidiosus]|uniref:Glycosyltransferase family 2 protein n=1 Tax=Pedobacter fastidiosus TaxID=2765361 RepID=A0ABR7KVG8_9SPHI|nr:glycosyltransferase family 2 protein [Pedobacter fastidiosus]MBC6112106.1 glycosyltransferase family 2 protein [Pedobacter fastidiosus]
MIIPSNLVTVIIPTYNRADKLPDAIESVINQTHPYVQILIIDDGSTDHTVEILKRYPTVEYYYKKNGGQASARNLGFKHSKGSIIATLDSDDIWYPDFLRRCVEKLEAENLDFVFTNWDQQTTDGKVIDFLRNDDSLIPYNNKVKNDWVNLESDELRELYIDTCPSPSSSVIMRKSSIISGWDERIHIGDDWCLYLETILSKKSSVAYTLDRLWLKRLDQINVYDGRKRSEILEFLYIADLEIKIEKFKNVLRKNELRIFQKRYMVSLVELAKHNFLREFEFAHAIKLLRRSFKLDVVYTFKAMPIVFMKSFRTKIIDKFKAKRS